MSRMNGKKTHTHTRGYYVQFNKYTRFSRRQEVRASRRDFTQKADLVCGICGAHGRARKKSQWGVSWTISELSASTPTSGRRLQPRTRGMAQNNGRTRGGTFHGEIDRCRENQGWTTACSGMPERDGKKNQEQDIAQSKRAHLAGSLALALLTSHKWRKLVSSWRLVVCRCHGVFSLYICCFVLLRFSSLSMLSLKPRPFVQSSFDMQACR